MNANAIFTIRFKKIVESIQYLTIATVDDNGQPWNTPVFTAYDDKYNFYWISSPLAQHSQNISQNDKVFLLIYDSSVIEGTGEGVYMNAKACELSDHNEINTGLKFIYGRKGKEPRPYSDFINTMPRRVYKAVPEKFWINTDEKINGHHLDKRIEVVFKYK